ncbi:MAG: hypothetical protein M0Z93_07040 [Actinomycetota bacterium]|jgi:hypothetical protein|nr:hypothetical protein [Actinomycetota bacterium]
MRYFLLVYDRRAARLASAPQVFDDQKEALRSRFDLERSWPGGDVEVVVLGGESLESLKTTHARYFANGFLPAAS